MLDTSDDYLTWDFTRSVSYARVRRAGPDRDVLPVAKRRSVRRAEKSPSGGVYLGFETRWLIPAATLPSGLRPSPADVLIDDQEEGADGTAWTVLTAELGRGGATWTLGCVDLVMAERLFDRITIEQAGASLDAAGVTVRAWPSGLPAGTPLGGVVLYANLPCRVQPITQETKDLYGVRGDQTTHTIYLSTQVQIDTRECRVVWPPTGAGSRVLDIVAVRNSSRIDQLPELEAVLKP